MARFQVPEIVTHANIRPLLAQLLEEPWFKIGARPKGPWPKDAWFYREAILEVPLGELAQGGLNTMALVGRSPYTTAPLTGKEGFNAQGLEGKALIRKPLFNALMNMRDLIGVHRGRIITRRLDEYAAGQKVDRNPGKRRRWSQMGADVVRSGPGWFFTKKHAVYLAQKVAERQHRKAEARKVPSRPKGHPHYAVFIRRNPDLTKLTDKQLYRLWVRLDKELRQGGGGQYGYDRPTLKITRPALYAKLIPVLDEVAFRGLDKNPGRNPGMAGGIKVLAGPFKDRREAARQRNIQARRGHKGLVKVISIPDAGLWYVICQRSKMERLRKNPGVHKSPPFRIQYLPVNQRWVMTWGEQIIDIRGVRSFPSRAAAIAAAKAAGIAVDPKTGICKNPGAAYHKREQARYSRLLAGDLKAKHKDAAEYWQGALSAEAAAVAAGKITRNPARRDLIAKAVLKFYRAQPDHIKKLMGRMSPEQLVLFVRKHSK